MLIEGFPSANWASGRSTGTSVALLAILKPVAQSSANKQIAAHLNL